MTLSLKKIVEVPLDKKRQWVSLAILKLLWEELSVSG
jgi:hypothetical protein